MGNNNKKVFFGFLWNLGEKMLIQLITFIVGLLLARKLGPETYGLVATVTVIISIITVSTNLYTGTYLMRKKEVDSLDMNTSFFFNLFVHLILYFLLFFIAPFIADFYGKTELVPLLRVMGVGMITSAFMGIKLVVIVRNYQYKKLFFASLVGTLIAGGAGIALAYTGYGPWALVASHCLDGFIDALILWIVVKWHPKFEFSFKRLFEMLKYGFPLWLFGVADSLSNRTQQLIIGKQYSSSDLAFYNRGESFPLIIESNSTSSLNDVLLRKISEEQDNIDSVRNVLNKITKLCLYISFPLMMGLAAVANTTIHLLLGDRWLPSVIFMQLFCLSFAIKPIESTSDVALKSVGKSKQFFVFGIIKKSLFIIGLLIAVPFGVEAIALSFLSASFLAAIVSIIANKICFKHSIIKQLSNIVIPILVSFAMWGLVSRIGLVLASMPSVLALIIQVISGAIFYIGSLMVIDREAIYNFKSLFISVFRKKADSKNERGKK